mgnify:CR=1 FL=1
MRGPSRGFTLYGKRKTFGQKLISFFLYLLLILLAYLVITSMFLQSFAVESVSMSPTILPGDRILSSPLTAGARIPLLPLRLPALGKLERGDLVIVRSPIHFEKDIISMALRPISRFFTAQQSDLSFSSAREWEQEVLLKRIIGIPGDTIIMKDYIAYIKPADSSDFISEFRISNTEYTTLSKAVPENWKEDFPFSGSIESETLEENEYFLLGDNRVESVDSRYWGALRSEAIVSKVFLRYWPTGSIGRP